MYYFYPTVSRTNRNRTAQDHVTVSGTGLSSGAAELYEDGFWARAGATLADGNNS